MTRNHCYILTLGCAVALLATSTGSASGQSLEKPDFATLMATGKLNADLGNYDRASQTFETIANDGAAPAALRWEALVRLGLTRAAEGNPRGSSRAFKKVLADYSADPRAMSFLTYAVAAVGPGKIWVDFTPELEDVLKTGQIVSAEELGMGLTGPKKVHVKKGEIELSAVWKPEGVDRLPGTYQAEIAAYEVDKMLGLDMVPPTAERSLDGRPGALQLWVYACKLYRDVEDRAPMTPEWSHQISRMQTFDYLIGDRDRSSAQILVDPDWRLVLIDHGFGFDDAVEETQNLPAQFDRALVQMLRRLDPKELEDRLGSLLGKARVRAILERRDGLLAHIDRLIAAKGEKTVLF